MDGTTSSAADRRITLTGYAPVNTDDTAGWTLRAPISTITIMGSGTATSTADLVRTTSYDPPGRLLLRSPLRDAARVLTAGLLPLVAALMATSLSLVGLLAGRRAIYGAGGLLGSAALLAGTAAARGAAVSRLPHLASGIRHPAWHRGQLARRAAARSRVLP